MASTIGTSTTNTATASGNNPLVTIAADGTCCVLWSDGTNTKFSYASSPYTSWTTTTLTTGIRNAMASMLDTSDNVVALAALTGGAINYFPLTKSGSTYSLGTAVQVTSNLNGQNDSQQVAKDTQGRYWSINSTSVGTTVQAFETSTPGTANWTSSLSLTGMVANGHSPASDIIGNFLVVVYNSASGVYKYQRLDVSGASLGSWSTAVAITMGGSVSPAIPTPLRGNGADVGVMAYQTTTGIWANVYTASTDTWASAVQLSSTNGDSGASVVKVGSDLYVFWSSFIGSNNLALVYKKYTVGTSTWDTSATTLIASGTNIHWANAGYGNNTIGIAYTVGTATPWNVNFATVVLAPTNNVMSGEDDLTVTDSLLIPGTDLFTDANTVSDIGGLQAWPIDTLTITDSLLISRNAVPIEALSAVDALLATDSYLPTDVLTITDSVVNLNNNLMAGEDDLVVDDSLSLFGDSALLVDVLTPDDSASSMVVVSTILFGAIGTSTNSTPTASGSNTNVTIAADGTALVLWFDGTNLKYSYASYPYASWTDATLTTGVGDSMSALLDTSDNVAVLAPITTGPITYFPLTKGGATYTLGASTQVTATSDGALQSQQIAKDGHGRYWSISNTSLQNRVMVLETTTPGTANWTSSLLLTNQGTAPRSPASDIVGNYLVVVFAPSLGTSKYQRLDVSGASLGSWSSALSITLGGSASSTHPKSLRGNGSGVGILAYADNVNGIYAQVYTAATDTWSTAVLLSSGASDTDANVIRVGNDLYVFWSANAGASNYSLVYKKYTVLTSTWDAAATTLVASGSNIRFANAGYGNNTLVVAYTVGTSTPYNVNIVTVGVGVFTNNVLSGEDDLSIVDSAIWTDGLVSVESLSITDSLFAVGGLVVNTTYSFVESLVVDDSLSQFGSDTTAVIEALTADDSLTQFTDSMNASPDDALSIDEQSVWCSTLPPSMFDGGPTPLTVYGTTHAATTITTANTLVANVTGGSGANKTTLIGTSLNFGQIWSQGNVAAWAAAASLGPFDGHGWLYDVTSLEGQQLIAGNFTPELKLSVSVNSIIADLYVRMAVYNATSHVYTQIGNNMTLLGKTISTTASIDTFAATAQPVKNFGTGDKLYIQVDMKITTNSTGSTLATISVNMSSSTTLGIAACSLVTNGTQSGLTNNLMSGEDDLVVSDSLLIPSLDFFVEVLVATDSLLIPSLDFFVDGLVVSDNMNSAGGMAAVDGLTVIDSVLYTRTALFVDALSVADSGVEGDTFFSVDGLVADDSASTLTQTLAGPINNVMSGIDALIVSDSGVFTQNVLFVDGLVVADSLLRTDSTLFVEAGSVADSLLSSDSTAWVEANTVVDVFSGLLSMVAVEALTAIDATVFADGYQSTDGLVVADLVLISGASIPVEALIGTDSLLRVDIYQGIDGLIADDSASTLTQTGSGMVFNNTMAGTDALIVSDTLLAQDGTVFVESLSIADTLTGSGQAYSFTDGLSIADTFIAQDSTAFVESLPASDSFTGTRNYVPSENLNALDSLLASMGYVPFEVVPIADSLLIQDGYIPIDSLSVSDLTSGMQVWSVDSLVVSDSLSSTHVFIPSDTLSINESLLVNDTALWVELLSVVDVFSGGSTPPVMVAIYSLNITWVTRDMKLTWVTRDMKLTWVTRDNTDTWVTRDEKDTWVTRDEQDTWVTRGR
jgi:hypothetical protein